MNLLQDVVKYVRRIIKSPSDQVITDGLIIDYVNRFYTSDVPLRVQLFDLKTKFNLETVPYVDQYNLPYYPTQNPDAALAAQGATSAAPYFQYQGLIPPVYVDGVQALLYVQRDPFLKAYPDYVQNNLGPQGDGGQTYTFNLAATPIIRGHLDAAGTVNLDQNATVYKYNLAPGVFLSATDANGNRITIVDTGRPVGSDYYIGGLVVYQDPISVVSANVFNTVGQVNYLTGDVTVTFPVAIPSSYNGQPNYIQTQYYLFQYGLPRMILFWNNILKLRPPPDKTYLIECDAYLTPAAFLSSSAALPFGYMAEYLARGAARKILVDTGDIEQVKFYEPFFKEQELLVWRRSSRQFSANRTPTIFSSLDTQAPYNGLSGAGN